MIPTFRHGVHPKQNKKQSMNCAFQNFSDPEILYVSLCQHIGAPANPVVNVGDNVLRGQLIGESAGFVSANIYSPVAGQVIGIEKRILANGNNGMHIVIKNDYSDQTLYLEKLETVDRQSVVDRIRQAGIVGMGGATFPTHVKLQAEGIDTLIINGAECEPYITSDYSLMTEKPQEIIKGIRYLMIALNVNRALVGIENNKPLAIRALADVAHDGIEIVPLRTKYPQGGEKQLIYSLLKRKVKIGELPQNVGVVVDNVHTAYAVYDAIDNCNPLYKRAMTVSGGGVNPSNILVSTGVLYKDIAERFQNGAEVKKVISGGPMMGFAQANLDASVSKGSSALLFLKEEETNQAKISPCINCARCVKSCPMYLMPVFIDKAVRRKDVDELEKLNASACVECGACAYVCPAKRPLVTSMKIAKKLLKERVRGGK